MGTVTGTVTEVTGGEVIEGGMMVAGIAGNETGEGIGRETSGLGNEMTDVMVAAHHRTPPERVSHARPSSTCFQKASLPTLFLL